MKCIEAEEKHISEITELWKGLVDYHSKIDSFFTRRDDAHLNFATFVKKLIEEKDSKVFICLFEEEVIGYIVAKIEQYPPIYILENYGEIYDLMVNPLHREKGVGSALLNLAINWFKNKKINRIELGVSPLNSIGYNFWKKKGFKEIFHKVFLEI